jgi:TolA-binding protein
MDRRLSHNLAIGAFEKTRRWSFSLMECVPMLKRLLLLLSLSCVAAFPMTQASLAQEDASQDDSETILRIGRLESTVRQLSGQIEELQFSNRQLQEQIKALQSGAPAAAAASSASASSASAASASKPIDLVATAKGASSETAAPAGTMAAQAAAAKTASSEPQKAAEAQKPLDPKGQVDAARGQLKAGDAEGAAAAMREFLKINPKDPNALDAAMVLGDAEYRLKHFPEAAQQYLKIAQMTPPPASAPLSFLKLGDALVGMNQKPQACGAYAEFGKRFPDADAALKARAERSKKGAGC